jgi:macrophage erythroblast attacher
MTHVLCMCAPCIQLEDITTAELGDAQRCRARLSHLKDLGPPERDGHIKWSRARIDRILVDHMLRSGYYEAASQLAHAADITQLVDIDIFTAARGVTEGLQRHDCTAALAWCDANRSRLRKAKSQLEFRLRLQEFVELLRKGHAADAIAYARTHMAQWGSQYLPELQRAAGALAFRPATTCPRYAALYAEERWGELADMFRGELYKLHAQPPVSALTVHLEAGLSALKTPSSYEAGCSREDPLHLPAFRKLAEGLPSAKHVHSKLVCAISREVMNEHNPPMVLPNGYVYSDRALAAMAVESGGTVTCPCTKKVYHISNVRRAFVS